MSYLIYIVMVTVTLLFFMTTSHTKNSLNIGSQAPDFSLTDNNGNVHTLSKLRGNKVALIFYPKDNSPGCTKQICSIRDNYSQLSQKNIIVLGISKGSEIQKKQFAEQKKLEFPLLMATNDVLKKYDAKAFLFAFSMPKRRTFLINEQGIICAIIKDIDFKNHAQQIIDGFNQVN